MDRVYSEECSITKIIQEAWCLSNNVFSPIIYHIFIKGNAHTSETDMD